MNEYQEVTDSDGQVSIERNPSWVPWDLVCDADENSNRLAELS